MKNRVDLTFNKDNMSARDLKFAAEALNAILTSLDRAACAADVVATVAQFRNSFNTNA